MDEGIDPGDPDALDMWMRGQFPGDDSDESDDEYSEEFRPADDDRTTGRQVKAVVLNLEKLFGILGDYDAPNNSIKWRLQQGGVGVRHMNVSGALRAAIRKGNGPFAQAYNAIVVDCSGEDSKTAFQEGHMAQIGEGLRSFAEAGGTVITYSACGDCIHSFTSLFGKQWKSGEHHKGHGVATQTAPAALSHALPALLSFRGFMMKDVPEVEA